MSLMLSFKLTMFMIETSALSFKDAMELPETPLYAERRLMPMIESFADIRLLVPEPRPTFDAKSLALIDLLRS